MDINDSNVNSGHGLNNPGTYDFRTAEVDHYTRPNVWTKKTTPSGLLNFVEANKGRILARQEAEGDVTVQYTRTKIVLNVGEYGIPTDEGRDRKPCVEINALIVQDENLRELQDLHASTWSTNDLANRLREIKHLFWDTQQWSDLQTNLRNFVARINEEREHKEDETVGEINKRYNRVLQSAPQWKADLKAALVAGGDDAHFTFDVVWDVRNGDVHVGLRCYEMGSRIREAQEAEVQRVCEQLKTQLPGVPHLLEA